eukprot:604681-Rhodomonas_salina.1
MGHDERGCAAMTAAALSPLHSPPRRSSLRTHTARARVLLIRVGQRRSCPHQHGVHLDLALQLHLRPRPDYVC